MPYKTDMYVDNQMPQNKLQEYVMCENMALKILHRVSLHKYLSVLELNNFKPWTVHQLQQNNMYIKHPIMFSLLW